MVQFPWMREFSGLLGERVFGRSRKWDFTDKGACGTAKKQGINKSHLRDAKRLPWTWTGLCKVCRNPESHSIAVPKTISGVQARSYAVMLTAVSHHTKVLGFLVCLPFFFLKKKH